MKKRIIAAGIATILAVSMIAGCSRSKSSDSGARDSGKGMNAGQTISQTQALSGEYNYTNGLSYEMNEDFAIEYEPELYDAGSDAGDIVTHDDVTVNLDPSQGRLLIRTVNITAETTDFSAVTTDVQSQVKALGGYIEYSSMSGTGNNRDLRTAYYTVRIPADKLDLLIEKVGSSCTVLASSENTSDVTLEYVDTKARIESLRVEYDQLLTLLSQAEDLDTILILQNRITEVRYQIESNESRIRVLENQVLYATLSLTVKEVLEETEVEEAHVVTYGEKVMNQFKDMWENTVEFFQDLLLGIITMIPGLIFIAVNVIIILIIVFSVRKKRRARRAKALAEKEAAEKKAAEEAAKEAAKKEAENKEAEKKDTSKDKKEEDKK